MKIGENYNKLLYWLSATGEGSNVSFANACRALGLVNEPRQVQSIQRRLILLGHIERSKDGSRWSICPSTIVQSIIDPQASFLCGQRTPRLLEQISALEEVKVIPQPQFNGPDCIKIISSTLDQNKMIQLCERTHAHLISLDSPRLSKLLPSLENWKKSLECLDRLNSSNYDLEKWNGITFQPATNFYERNNRYFGETGFYRLIQRSASQFNTHPKYLYFDEDLQKWFEGDYYGLRFLACCFDKMNTKATLQTSTNTLRITSSRRWPMLYERALVSISGILPDLSGDSESLVYQDIIESDAWEITQKLRVELEIYENLSLQRLREKEVEKYLPKVPLNIELRIRWLLLLILKFENRDNVKLVFLHHEARHAFNKLQSIPEGQILSKLTIIPSDLMPYINALTKLINQLEVK